MAASVSSNDSLLHPGVSAVMTSIITCVVSQPSSVMYFSFYTTSILLLLPLCTFVLYLGVRRWRQRRSASSAAAMSHSDAFTYHLVAMELVGVLANALCCYGIRSDDAVAVMVGYSLSSFTWYGETTFHTLTCVERYLAVVHPVTYRDLRSQRGIRMRNAIIGAVWLVCAAETTLMLLKDATIYMCLCSLIISFVVISFCSLSVLCALIRPGPGHHGGDRVDQSKRRAFYTILAILGVLFVRCSWNLAWLIMFLSGIVNCAMMSWPIWFNLPCSLVLPVLFLHRAGIIACCRRAAEKG